LKVSISIFHVAIFCAINGVLDFKVMIKQVQDVYFRIMMDNGLSWIIKKKKEQKWDSYLVLCISCWL